MAYSLKHIDHKIKKEEYVSVYGRFLYSLKTCLNEEGQKDKKNDSRAKNLKNYNKY